jgi:hypothetical protein
MPKAGGPGEAVGAQRVAPDPLKAHRPLAGAGRERVPPYIALLFKIGLSCERSDFCNICIVGFWYILPIDKPYRLRYTMVIIKQQEKTK